MARNRCESFSETDDSFSYNVLDLVHDGPRRVRIVRGGTLPAPQGLGWADVLVIGPGLTAGKTIREVIRRLLESATVPMVFDADAVNAAASMTGLFERAKAPVVLTPHPGEMARLLKAPAGARLSERIQKIEQDRIRAARSFADSHPVALVLKGVPTVITEHGGRTFINTSGNAGMATAGSGRSAAPISASSCTSSYAACPDPSRRRQSAHGACEWLWPVRRPPA